MVFPVGSFSQDGIKDVQSSADGANKKKGFTTHARESNIANADFENGQQPLYKGESICRRNPRVYGPDQDIEDFIYVRSCILENDLVWKRLSEKIEEHALEFEDALIKLTKLIEILEDKDYFPKSSPGALENLKRSEYDSEEDCYEQNKEQEINLPVKSTLFSHKCNSSVICEDNQKDHVEKQKDVKESPDKSTITKGSKLKNGIHVVESLCQDVNSADPPSTQETKYKKNPNQPFNKTGWGTIILILLIFCAGSSSATTTGLDVRPITKVALDERIELQCKKVNDGGTKWYGGPKNELLTIGKTVQYQYTNYFSLIDTNETYNLVIENATWEFVNASYTCHVSFIRDSTKRLSEYGYEVIPKLESLTVMRSKKSECLNETIEFKKVNPLPNCTTSLDKNVQVEVTYFHKQWYGYYYAVTVGLVVKNCDGCNGTMHCYVGNEILNITFEQDRKAEPSPLGKDEESDSQTGLIVGLGVGVMAAVVIVGVIIRKLYKRGICRGKTKRQERREGETDIQGTPLVPRQNNQAGENEV